MSKENVETLREMFALVNHRGVRAATDAFGHLRPTSPRLRRGDSRPAEREG